METTENKTVDKKGLLYVFPDPRRKMKTSKICWAASLQTSSEYVRPSEECLQCQFSECLKVCHLTFWILSFPPVKHEQLYPLYLAILKECSEVSNIIPVRAFPTGKKDAYHRDYTWKYLRICVHCSLTSIPSHIIDLLANLFYIFLDLY